MGKRLIKRVLTGALLLAMAALLMVLIGSGREIVTRLDEYQAARAEYSDLREQFGTSPSTENEEDDAETEGIDFDALRAINPNVVGWIIVPGTEISYPIVQGGDNRWYLYHTFRGELNASGTIFMDFRNSADFSDEQTILHGHNMRDDSMFASLLSWTGDRFMIHTPNGMLEFEVFNRQTVEATHEIYQLHETENGTRVVTLSTCVNESAILRFVVQGM